MTRQDNYEYFKIERLNNNRGMLFYNQYPSNSFLQSEPLNLSDFKMKPMK